MEAGKKFKKQWQIWSSFPGALSLPDNFPEQIHRWEKGTVYLDILFLPNIP